MTLIILPGSERAQTCLSRENSREEVSGGLCLCFWFRSTFSVVFPGNPVGWQGYPCRALWESTSLSALAQASEDRRKTQRVFGIESPQPVPETCCRAKCSVKQMRSPLSQRCAALKWLNGLNLIYLNRTWGLFSRMLQHKYLWFTLTLQFFCWFLYL